MVSKRISRDDYLNKLIAFKDKQLIKVINGNLSGLFAKRNECNKEADYSNKS